VGLNQPLFTMNNVWVQSANNFALREVSQQMSVLPRGVYKIMVDPYENLYLSHIQEKFTFPYKVYGIERSFIDRVKKSWKYTTGNMGVVLNGLKGTGKTVTAEIICNEVELPVIIVPFHHAKLVSFLNDIQQDVIILIDEYEKIYDGYKTSLLSIMDGALNTQHRMMFLMTTNDLDIDRNLLQRPSRVRYVKMFTDMSLEVIMEVVDDLLEYEEYREETIQFISELPIITMDLVKSVIQEVNIHQQTPYVFKEVFNVNGERDQLYNIYEMQENGEKKLLYSSATINYKYFSDMSVGNELYVNRRHFAGDIEKVISSSQIIISKWANDDDDDDRKRVTSLLIFEKAVKTHNIFNAYAF
jgi:SpoVK/Ycf46/Vps4 family AAA+-type ATPase